MSLKLRISSCNKTCSALRTVIGLFIRKRRRRPIYGAAINNTTRAWLNVEPE